ncbi:MAG TPA: PIN domain-containing protein [Agriterribacter sp.]|nr:PIN domain-containing protein [Agriterribacter sp.]
MDLTLSPEAAKIKASHKLSFADAFAAALTIQKNGTLVTGDDEFETLKGLPGFKMKRIF